MNINQYRIQESRYESIFSYLDSYISYSHSKISHFFIKNVRSYILCHNLEFCKIFVKNIFPGDDFSCN